MRRVGFALAAAAAMILHAGAAWPDPIKIGVLTDLSGPYADITGKGSVTAAQMAVEDFGPTVRSGHG